MGGGRGRGGAARKDEPAKQAAAAAAAVAVSSTTLATRACANAFRRSEPPATHRLMAASTACVSLVAPTAALPCFTASMAYSAWKSRPAGENVVVSVSYISARRRRRERRGGQLGAGGDAGRARAHARAGAA